MIHIPTSDDRFERTVQQLAGTPDGPLWLTLMVLGNLLNMPEVEPLVERLAAGHTPSPDELGGVREEIIRQGKMTIRFGTIVETLGRELGRSIADHHERD